MSYQVQLHVYDLSGGMAKQHSRQMMQRQLDGVWNSGVVVYGKEFYYGNGICYDLPGRTPFGQPTKIMDLGITEIPEEFMMQMVSEIKDEFNIMKFNVIKNNVNHFSDRLTMLLLGTGIAADIVNQAQVLFSSQVGQQMAPLLVQAQQSLMIISNPLFTEGAKKFPLKIKKAGHDAEEQKQQQPGQMDPNFQAMLDQFGNIGDEGQQPTQPQAQRSNSYQAPVMGEVCHIQNQAHLSKIIKDSQAVVVDFWSATCGPCMRFKPMYEGAARGNKNKHIIFCAVDCDNCGDAAQAHNIRSIPQLSFFLNGKEHAKFVGADEHKFRKHLEELHEQTMSKAGNHMSMGFKQFKPMNRLPVGFTQTGQIDKMKEFITKLANQSKTKVNYLQQWLSTFDIKKMPRDAIDQLIALAETAEDKSKIALVDLLRLVVLDEDQAEYVFSKHWHNLVEVAIIGYIEKTDLTDSNARVIHNYHLASFKFLTNAYQTSSGRQCMQDPQKGLALVQFCTRSFLSCNHKTILHSALCLFNHLLCHEAESFQKLSQDLIQAMKAIDEFLSGKESTGADQETLLAVLLCECRILYKNQDVCGWVEETFKSFFIETHAELKKRCQQDNLRQAIDDVLSMVVTDDKK